jgi:hypothetical protein
MSVIVLPVILIGIGMFVVGFYGSLFSGRNRCKNGIAQIDVKTRRHD